MAIKQRLLKELEQTKSLLGKVCLGNANEGIFGVLSLLKKIDCSLQQGLKQNCYAQYKEIINGVEVGLRNSNSSELSEVCSLSKDLLSIVEKRVEDEINFRKEMVFLPYSSSMWDSMESVWQAANDDKENTVAYVVPIPYFDRNPDGSIHEWHCDAGKFPHYVPIRDYRSINLEEMRPDVIVIHSPYDDTNIVTSVHPDYYSRNLKSYTDKLVYIPYFVLEEVDPKDGDALGSISHFVLTPGVYNADVTIVQSEDMRKAYVEILTQLSEVKDRSYWEKRILGLGSPKIDKVLSTKRENVKLPESWRRIIEKPDGTRKKVIFYNVSLSSLLEYEDKLLDKMEWVFGIFHERQNEVALLWRPHPLFVSTLESMKPELLARYRSMVERYKREGWGIYDDTPELHRSIAISDAYYGDGSSLVTMFCNIGKSAMIQSILIRSLDYCVGMDNVIEYEEKWWFLNFYDNGIYRMDKETFKAELVVRIPWKTSSKMWRPEHCYGEIHIYDGKIFAVPWTNVPIAVYDLNKNVLRYIEYEKVPQHQALTFYGGFEKERYLFLIPCTYNSILKVDMKQENIVYRINLDEYVRQNSIHCYAWGSIYCKNEYIYMGMCWENIVLQYNIETGAVSVRKIAYIKNGISGICGDNEHVWIIPRWCDCIYYKERKERKVKVIKGFPINYFAGDRDREISFYKIYMSDHYLYMLPTSANMVLILDKKRKKIIKWIEDSPKDTYGDCENLFGVRWPCVWNIEKNMYIIYTKKREVYCFDEKERYMSTYRITLNIKDKLDDDMVNFDFEMSNKFENIINFIKKRFITTNRYLIENNIIGKGIYISISD